MLPEFANCGVGTSLFWPRIWRNRGLGSLAKSYFSGRPFCKCFRFFSAGLGAWDRPEGELTVQEGRLRLSGAIFSSGGGGVMLGWHFRSVLYMGRQENNL